MSLISFGVLINAVVGCLTDEPYTLARFLNGVTSGGSTQEVLGTFHLSAKGKLMAASSVFSTSSPPITLWTIEFSGWDTCVL